MLEVDKSGRVRKLVEKEFLEGKEIPKFSEIYAKMNKHKSLSLRKA